MRWACTAIPTPCSVARHAVLRAMQHPSEVHHGLLDAVPCSASGVKHPEVHLVGNLHSVQEWVQMWRTRQLPAGRHSRAGELLLGCFERCIFKSGCRCGTK